MLRAVLPPLFAAYALFVAMVVRWTRRPARRRPPARSPSPSAARRMVLGLSISGYGVFLAIVLVFHTWLAAEADAMATAAWGGAALIAMAMPAFLALSWAERRWRSRQAC